MESELDLLVASLKRGREIYHTWKSIASSMQREEWQSIPGPERPRTLVSNQIAFGTKLWEIVTEIGC